jgi:hypothetical protein
MSLCNNYNSIVNDIYSVIKDIKSLEIKELAYNITFVNIDFKFTSLNIDALIEIRTDFDNFGHCSLLSYTDKNNSYVSLSNLLNKYNIQILILQNFSHLYLINELVKLLDNISNTNKYIIPDPFNIRLKSYNFTKTEIDYELLESQMIKQSSHISLHNSNTNFTKCDLIKILIKEIKFINTNRTYQHSILIDYNNPFNITFRLKFSDNAPISKILNEIDTKHIEFTLSIYKNAYPIFPPKLIYNGPRLDNSFLFNILNINILKLSNWSYTITLEHIILSIAKIFEDLGLNYIVRDPNYNFISYKIIELLSLTSSYNLMEYIDFQTSIIKKPKMEQKLWKSGVGFSSDHEIYNNATTLMTNK